MISDRQLELEPNIKWSSNVVGLTGRLVIGCVHPERMELS